MVVEREVVVSKWEIAVVRVGITISFLLFKLLAEMPYIFDSIEGPLGSGVLAKPLSSVLGICYLSKPREEDRLKLLSRELLPTILPVCHRQALRYPIFAEKHACPSKSTPYSCTSHPSR